MDYYYTLPEYSITYGSEYGYSTPYKKDYVTVVKIPKSDIVSMDIAACKEPTQTPTSFYSQSAIKPTVVCNGGFFNMGSGTPCFNLIDNGKVLSSNMTVPMGIAIINGLPVYGDINILKKSSGFVDFISAYPPFIVDYIPTMSSLAKEVDYKARRTILAYDDKDVYIIAVEDPGMTFKECKDMLMKLHVRYAINLDGGGSTNIVYEGKQITKDGDNRAVDNVVCIYTNKPIKPETPVQPVIYRVQVGAFTVKAYADEFLKQIQSLEDNIGANYKGAYIRQIDNYYKIQVGAYYIKENAYRVVEDLKKKGYNPFVTTL